MKFLAFIASAMLIALISQHSIMGLPLNGTVVCSEGMQLIDGQCVLSSSFNTSIGSKNASPLTDILPLRIEESYTKLTPVKIAGSCPPGMQHGEHGICEYIQTSTSSEVKLSTTPAYLDQPTTEFHDLSAKTGFADVSTTTEFNVPTGTLKPKSATWSTTAETPRNFDEVSTTTTPLVDIEATTGFIGESTTTKFNTPSTRRLQGKSATWSTTAETPRNYDEVSTTTTPLVDIEATTGFIGESTTTKFDTPSTRRLQGKSATWSTTAETPGNYDEVSTTTTPLVDIEATTGFIGESTTTKFTTPSTRRLQGKSATWSTTGETPGDYDEFSTTTELNTPSTRRFKGKSTTFKTSTQTPSDYDELSTTTERDEYVGGVDVIKGCPKGTQPDQDGACVSAQPVNSTKVITNLKDLLVNGSCPTDYKMIEGRCLYIKSKKNPTLYQTGAQPKSSVSSQSEDELVSVLDDNSCPEGTEYSEFGLCRKRIYATTPRLSSIDKLQFTRSKSTSRVIVTTTPSKGDFSVSKTTPAVEEESAYENHTEETPSPL